MKLYEITNEYLSVFNELNNIDGLDNETIENTLAPIKQDINKKSINIAAYIKNLEADVDSISDYIQRMNERKKTKQNKIDSIKNYLRFNMEQSGISKIESIEFTISLGAEDVKTEIYDSSILPINVCRKVEKFEPDKILIKQKIINGEEIDGARIIKTRRLTIK